VIWTAQGGDELARVMWRAAFYMWAVATFPNRLPLASHMTHHGTRRGGGLAALNWICLTDIPRLAD